MADEMLPRDRAELLWEAIINHTIEAVDAIRDRPELIAAAIAAGLPDMLGDPRDRYELFLKAIAGANVVDDRIGDSLAGWEILYERENLSFNGTTATIINTGVPILSSAYADKDIKVIFRDINIGVNSGTSNVLFQCKTETGTVAGTKISVYSTQLPVPGESTGDSRIASESKLDVYVFKRIGGVYSGTAFRQGKALVGMTIAGFEKPMENPANVILGGSLVGSSFGQPCNATIGSVTIAIK